MFLIEAPRKQIPTSEMYESSPVQDRFFPLGYFTIYLTLLLEFDYISLYIIEHSIYYNNKRS